MAYLHFQAGHLTPTPSVMDLMQRFATREEYLEHLEEERRSAVQQRRLYYEGRQYDDANAECLRLLDSAEGSLGEKAIARLLGMWGNDLPEHQRLHAYSTQIAESIDFIAARLTNKASIRCEDDTVQKVVDACLDASPELRGTDDDQELTLLNPVREAMKAGDTVVLLRWDLAERTCWMEFWDSDTVELRFDELLTDELELAIVEEVDWRVPPGGTEVAAVKLRRTWRVETRPVVEGLPVPFGVDTGEVEVTGIREECVETVEIVEGHGQAEPIVIDRIGWGVPFLPWWLLRGDKKNLRATRGESLITDQAMSSADRYNAVEQTSWLIARYNSHSNIAVTGDSAQAMMANATRVQKDVADLILIPGSTGATALSLPTDPQMIVHQVETLKDALYGIMGVTRVDQTSLQGLGGVTGYALEILNQKTDNTFTRVRNQLTQDLKKLLNLVLDCTAFWQASAVSVESGLLETVGEELETELPVGYDSIDPQVVFANRGIKVEFGTGYVVDEAKLRDDYNAGLVSLEYVLRKKGLSEPEIVEMIEQLDKEKEKKLAQQAEQQRLTFGATGTESGSFAKRSTSAGGIGRSSQSPRTARAG